MTLTPEEAETCRQWFNAVLDVTPEYLVAEDYRLAADLYEQMGMRIPDAIRARLLSALDSRSRPQRQIR